MPSVSPRTQQLQMASGAGVDQATALFERGFSDMSYNVLTNKFPDLVPDVVTFKVLDSDVERGVGVGAFVVMRGDRPLYVPVVMSDNNVKPLELVYDKALNVFLPLSKGWLSELDKTSLSALGRGIKTPESLYTDVDIRNIVVPPITGRFSYAAWEPVILADVARVFTPESLEKAASEPAATLLAFLSAAPNAVKLAFRTVIEKNRGLLKHAVAAYGATTLGAALAPHAEKVAAKQQYGGALWIVDKDNTPTDFKRIFGDRAGEAYAGVRRKGYAAKDDRLVHNLAVEEQPYARWVEPRQPGVYVLRRSTGEDAPALVVPNPIDLLGDGTRYGRRAAVPGHNPLVNNSYYDPRSFGGSVRYYPSGRPDEGQWAVKRSGDEFLAILGDGDYLETPRLAGRDSVADAVAGGPLHKRLFEDVSGEPRQGLGVWVRQKGTTFQATRPVRIKSVMNRDGERRVVIENAGGWDERTVVTCATHPYGTIFMPKGSNIVYLPPDFVWIPLKKRLEPRSFFTSALDLAGCVSSALADAGAKKVSIKDAGAGQYSINGSAALAHVPALRKLATEFLLTVDDAAALLEKAASDRHAKAWIVSGETLALAQLKLGADESSGEKKPKKKAPPSDPGADAGAEDPAAMGDPSADPNAAAMMAAAAQPPEPSPTDLAAMEMDQHIQQEIQKLQEKQQMLAMLTQRANEIAGGAAPMPTVQTQAMGAPPPAQNLATGAPAAPPSGAVTPPGGAMPQPPGADPMAAGGAMPPGDPSMMGSDPSMGGGMQPQPPSMAMMGPDGPSADTLASQINPQFLSGAAALPGGDIFDAAAVASLAQSPAVRDIVSQYLPNLEKALDNLGRVLLSLEMQEPNLKEEIGELAFNNLEENLRNTLRGMGDLVLHLSQSAHVLKDPREHAPA